MAISSVSSKSLVTFGLLFVALVAVIALLCYCIPRSSSAKQQVAAPVATEEEEERFANYASAQLDQTDEATAGGVPETASAEVAGSETVQAAEEGNNEMSFQLDTGASAPGSTDPNSCFPKDTKLQPEELLPADSNSTWAQSCPAGQGALNDGNLLLAGYHVGVNTVGSSLRNANMQLRSEPANPQVSVGPWNQTTIEPDVTRKPLEINGSC